MGSPKPVDYQRDNWLRLRWLKGERPAITHRLNPHGYHQVTFDWSVDGVRFSMTAVRQSYDEAVEQLLAFPAVQDGLSGQSEVAPDRA